MKKQWNFQTYDEMAKNVADKVIHEYEINGKTLDEWMDLLAEYLKEHEAEKNVPHDV